MRSAAINPLNPYDFVPFEANPPQRPCPAQTQATFDPNFCTGEMVCKLHTETPLFIHRQQGGQPNAPRPFYRRRGQIVIPASSLKGMIRTVAEVVSNSCLRVVTSQYAANQPGYEMSEEYKYGRDGTGGHFRTYGSRLSRSEFEDLHKPIPLVPEELGPRFPANAGVVPTGHWACAGQANLCPCCALFGMTERADDSDERNKAMPLAGRVWFSEARQAGNNEEKTIEVPHRIGPPHPYHQPFYFSNGKLLGRKFYYHHQDYQETLRVYKEAQHRDWITVQPQTGDFTFTVRFHNLCDDESAVLMYSLMLEDDMRHHLGYGKPFGLGTVKITVTEMRRIGFDGGKPSRYLDYEDETIQTTWHTVDATKWRDKGKQRWTGREGAKGAYEKFKAILKYPQTQTFRYPTFSWFRRSPNRNATLADYQRDPKKRM